MARQKTVSADDAMALAIRYHAYHQAVNVEDWSGVALWGEWLGEVQDKTGVTLTSDQTRKSLIIAAKRKLAETEEIK